jgi:hypothetical protein
MAKIKRQGLDGSYTAVLHSLDFAGNGDSPEDAVRGAA